MWIEWTEKEMWMRLMSSNALDRVIPPYTVVNALNATAFSVFSLTRRKKNQIMNFGRHEALHE